MSYLEYVTTKKDNDLSEIKNLKYLPWIGKNALLKDEKILIIGESVYNWGKNEEEKKIAQTKLKKNDFARVVIFEHGVDTSSGKRRFARNIEKILGNEIKDSTSRKLFWSEIFFHELVQRPLKNRKDRPTDDDYKIGAEVLVEIIKFIKLKKCIFLGTTWSKFASLKLNLKKYYDVNEYHFPKMNNSKPKILDIVDLNSKIYFIKHPSMAFSPEKWKVFLDNN
jgi:hypothetical protein